VEIGRILIIPSVSSPGCFVVVVGTKPEPVVVVRALCVADACIVSEAVPFSEVVVVASLSFWPDLDFPGRFVNVGSWKAGMSGRLAVPGFFVIFGDSSGFGLSGSVEVGFDFSGDDDEPDGPVLPDEAGAELFCFEIVPVG
jgi:hypothetical protein